MQSVDKNGLLGEVSEFQVEAMKKMPQNPNIDHVDVFNGTPQNIEHRKKLEGKKYRPFKVSQGIKKPLE